MKILVTEKQLRDILKEEAMQNQRDIALAQQLMNDPNNEVIWRCFKSTTETSIFQNGYTSEYFGDDVRIQCIMPNTPAMVGEGVMLFEGKNTLTETELSYIKDLFGALGIIETLPTDLMRIGGAISGCGPAFMDLIMEAYADAAVKYGIPRATAYNMVAMTVLGSAKLQLESGKHPAVLKDEVCSPGGTTIRGVATLEEKGLRDACISSIDAIMDYKKR